MKLSALAALVNGQLVGEDKEVSGVRGLDEAGPLDVTFLANIAYLDKLAQSQAGAVLVATDIPTVNIPKILVKDPYLAMATIANKLYAFPKPPPGIHPSAVVDPTAKVDPSAYIGPCSVIEARAVIGAGAVLKAQVYVGEQALIGNDSILYPGVKIVYGCRIGQRNILYPGVVIGADGFGYTPDQTGHRHKIPQVGIVELEDDVEVGANSTIDRATFGVTKIGAGTKIDNLVMVAHNVQIGHDTVLCSQVGIAGSTTIGDRVICAGQSGVNGHINIGNDCIVAGQSGVAQSLPAGSKVAGSPALPHLRWLKVSLVFSKLDDMMRRITKLERRLAQNSSLEENTEC